MMRNRIIPHPSALILFLILGCAQRQQPHREIQRVITLAPNITELTFAIGCGGKVVGTDSYSDTPRQAKALPKLGGVEPDIEKIVALRPDLVIASASAAHPNLRRALGAAHIPLLVVKTDRLSDVATAMTTMGHATGCDAGQAVAAFNKAIGDQRHFRTKSPRLLYAVWTDPLYIAGRKTFIDDLYELTGARNAADVTGWPQYSLEAFVVHPPDLLLHPNRSVTREAVGALIGRAHLPVETAAVDEDVFSRPGPRLPQAAAELNRICDQWERTH